MKRCPGGIIASNQDGVKRANELVEFHPLAQLGEATQDAHDGDESGMKGHHHKWYVGVLQNGISSEES